VIFRTWCDRAIQETATSSLRGGYDAIPSALAERQGILIGQKKGTGALLTGFQRGVPFLGLFGGVSPPPFGGVEI